MIKEVLKVNLKNAIHGQRVSQKIVIFDSDDWGSNYFSSKKNYDKLIESGVISPKSVAYSRYDSLARAEDLEILFDTLRSVTDCEGKHPIFSTFFAPTNPDFEKIEKDKYQKYHYESFLQTLSRTEEDLAVLHLWKNGINEKLISVAYHAREHLCIPIWMEHLQNNHKKVRDAFAFRFCSVDINSLPKGVKAFRPTLYFQNSTQMKANGEALVDGINVLKSLFGASFSVFAPPNGVSHPYYDALLKENGIMTIHNSHRFEPNGKGGGTTRVRSMNSNKLNQVFYDRNCRFEPTSIQNDLSKCLLQIQGAFNWNKPAIISTHRVNYIGSISKRNRDTGISQLKLLLNAIVKKWPDVVFASSEDYSKMLHNREE